MLHFQALQIAASKTLRKSVFLGGTSGGKNAPGACLGHQKIWLCPTVAFALIP